jgi:hypothetical protein
MHQFGVNPKWVKHMHVWGEAGTVSVKESKHPKVKNKGVKMMFVGYPDDHPGDCFTMWDPVTERTHCTRDVIFLGKMFFDPPVGAGEGRIRNLNKNKTSNRFDVLESSSDDSSDEDDEEEEDVPQLMKRNQAVYPDDSSDDESDDEDDEAGEGKTTRFGRRVMPVERVGFDRMGELRFPFMSLSKAESEYYQTAEKFPEAFGRDVCLVGAGPVLAADSSTPWSSTS